MSKLRFAGAMAGILALTGLSALIGYRKGIQDANEKESKAWAPLLASGWLEGSFDRADRWAEKVDSKEVDSFMGSYQEHYDHLVKSAAEVPANANARWLVDNHLKGKKTPETVRGILEEYQKRKGSTPPSPSE